LRICTFLIATIKALDVAREAAFSFEQVCEFLAGLCRLGCGLAEYACEQGNKN
jgi:hypothetical protein